MYKVVITDTLKPVVPEEAILRGNEASLVYGDAKMEADLIELTRDAHAIISVYAPLTEKVIQSLQQCMIIVRRGIGYDNVDVETATKKGIPVANVPGFCVDEVADHAMSLLLCAIRKLISARDRVRSGQWDFRQFAPIPALRDCTLGLVGFGRIGYAMAQRARGFGLRVQASDPFASVELVAKQGVSLVSLEELLRSSDVISLHCPLTSQTHGMFSKQEFEIMKPSVVLVNTSRGALIDESALCEALESGKIGFAALDVLTQEPPEVKNPLLRMENVIVSPHVGWYSERAVRLLGEKTAEEIIRVFEGYPPKSLLNPEVLKTLLGKEGCPH